jgi:murein DD-endopeptidase MepM/ murein hydrolase activator NlpD
VSPLFRLVLASICTALLTAACGAPDRGTEHNRTSALADQQEMLARLDARVAVLEALLGLPEDPVDPDAPARLRPGYEELRARTERLARQDGGAWARLPTLPPVRGARVSSPYTATRFHPITRRVQSHFGLDLAAPAGTPILAAGDGLVAAVANTPAYGLGVDIDHGNGFVTRYAHASRILVEQGQSVRRGQVIALVGSTGLSTGPHLHYEIFRHGWSVDPFDFLLDRGARVGEDAP